MRLHPTRRAGGFALAAFIVYALATNTEVVWLYLVAALLLALVPLGVAGPALSLRAARLELERIDREGFVPPLAVDRGKTFAGDRVRMRLRSSFDPGRLADCEVIAAPDGQWLVEAVDAGEREVVVTLVPARRGQGLVRAVRLTSRWPLGLATAAVEVPLQVPVLVHPRYWLPPPSRRGGAATGILESRRRGIGEQFFALREYRSGDSQRRIHWTTTARSGTLMVAETEAEVDAGHVVRIELEPGATVGAVDLAASVAASLVAAGVREGSPVRLEAGPDRLASWREILGSLATISAAAPGAARFEGTRVRAAGAMVLVDRGEQRLSLPAGISMVEAQQAMGKM